MDDPRHRGVDSSRIVALPSRSSGAVLLHAMCQTTRRSAVQDKLRPRRWFGGKTVTGPGVTRRRDVWKSGQKCAEPDRLIECPRDGCAIPVGELRLWGKQR